MQITDYRDELLFSCLLSFQNTLRTKVSPCVKRRTGTDFVFLLNFVRASSKVFWVAAVPWLSLLGMNSLLTVLMKAGSGIVCLWISSLLQMMWCSSSVVRFATCFWHLPFSRTCRRWTWFLWKLIVDKKKKQMFTRKIHLYLRPKPLDRPLVLSWSSGAKPPLLPLKI